MRHVKPAGFTACVGFPLIIIPILPQIDAKTLFQPIFTTTERKKKI